MLRVTAEWFSCPPAAWESFRSPLAGLLAAPKHDKADQTADKQVLQGLLQQPVQGLLLQPNSAQADLISSARATCQPLAPKRSSSCWCSKGSTGLRITGWSQSRGHTDGGHWLCSLWSAGHGARGMWASGHWGAVPVCWTMTTTTGSAEGVMTTSENSSARTECMMELIYLLQRRCSSFFFTQHRMQPKQNWWRQNKCVLMLA